MDVHFSKYGAHKFLLLHQTKYVQLLLRHTVRCLMIFHSHTQNAASAVDFSSLRVAAWQVLERHELLCPCRFKGERLDNYAQRCFWMRVLGHWARCNIRGKTSGQVLQTWFHFQNLLSLKSLKVEAGREHRLCTISFAASTGDSSSF